MSIYNKLRELRQPSAVYSPAFRQVLFDHMDVIKAKSSSMIREIEPALAYKYIGNMKGLLMEIGVAPDLHWVAMRINGLTNDFRNIGSVERIMMPDSNYVNQLWSIFTAKKR